MPLLLAESRRVRKAQYCNREKDLSNWKDGFKIEESSKMTHLGNGSA